MTYVICAVNVNHALHLGLQLLREHGVEEDSRAGRVLVMPGPVSTQTYQPQERVLFDPYRDANPFFHLMEALWMLNGGQDARFLDQFVHDFSARFGEPDGVLHGAYGYRWRHTFGFDQIEAVISKLNRDPTDRQAVIQMWDCCVDDPNTNDLLGIWKDRPCNTHIYLRVNGGVLDLTVCCRSNDAIWGAHGANAVHFSILQEYIAARLGIPVGTMTQFSNNYHVYLDVLIKMSGDRFDRYESDTVKMIPLVNDTATFDAELALFIVGSGTAYANPFLKMAGDLWQTHRVWKQKGDWRAELTRVPECDWKIACTEWLERRQK